MNLKFSRYRYLLPFCLVFALHAQAQSITDSAHMECRYIFEYPVREEVRTDMILLQCGNKVSKSYSYYTWQCDSAGMTPQGREAKIQAMNAFVSARVAGDKQAQPRYYRRSGWFVYKNWPEGMTTVTDNISLQYFRYSEPQVKPEWEIGSDTCRVMDYLCYQAKTVWHGRKWTAWFTPDIPVGDGPWKLCGLPGLILKAESEDGIYRFTARELRMIREPLVFHTPYDVAFKKTTRQKLLTMHRKFLEDSGFYTIVTTGSDMGFLKSTPTKITYDLLECDYR